MLTAKPVVMLLVSIRFREDEIKYIWNSDLPCNHFLEGKGQFNDLRKKGVVKVSKTLLDPWHHDIESEKEGGQDPNMSWTISRPLSWSLSQYLLVALHQACSDLLMLIWIQRWPNSSAPIIKDLQKQDCFPLVNFKKESPQIQSTTI